MIIMCDENRLWQVDSKTSQRTEIARGLNCYVLGERSSSDKAYIFPS